MTYLEWLIDLVSEDDYHRYSYQKLFSLMLDKEFDWFIKNDGNRAIDGEELRDLYFKETGLDSCKDGPCSVMEMFVALAIRCEMDIMYDPSEGDRTSMWFWIMMENLELDDLDDNTFSYEIAEDILDTFLSRRYCKDGYRGPFYVSNSKVDLRKVELWYQLNYYLQENFPI